MIIKGASGPRVAQNCGQLLGQLDELLPFIYIAQYGASDHDLGAHATDVANRTICCRGNRPVGSSTASLSALVWYFRTPVQG